MESLISDKNALDPELVVPREVLGGGTYILLMLWRGLPQSWALATFVVCSVAVSTWNFSECVAGLIIATLIACLKGSCGNVRQTPAGAWLLVLHHFCRLTAVVVGVRNTLQYMAGHSSWLTSQMALCPRLASLSVLVFIITLHALGLERSRILRRGLLACIPATLLMMFVGELMLFNGEKAIELFYQHLPTLNKVAESAAFFSLVFSNSLCTCLTAPDKKLTFLSFLPIKALFVSCFASIGFLSLALIDIRDEATGEVLFLSILTKERGGSTWRFLRGGLAVVSMTSLSLSLVEIVAKAQRGVVGVAGMVLPPQVARIHWWTGTQLSAIIITGLYSAVLLFLPLQLLISLSSTTYILSEVCDFAFIIFRSYQPSFVPKNYGSVGNGGSYQLLPDTAALMDGDSDCETQISDDSGHSSDTDIDAAVHEYKQIVKVAKTMEEPRPTPTIRSARIAIFSLTAMMAASFVMAAALEFGHSYVLFLNVLVVVFVIYVISKQPQDTDEQGHDVFSPWQFCITLALHLILAALLIPQLWAPLVTWVGIGLVLWLVQKRRQWWHLQERLSKHADRVKLPRAHLAQSFQPSYQKLSTLDTVHIMNLTLRLLACEKQDTS